MKKIIVDTYGADIGHVEIIRGALSAVKEIDDLYVVIVGDESIIRDMMKTYGTDESRVEIVHTDKYITNDDPPTCVFKGKDDTSMVMSLDRLSKSDDVMGMVSAGNTGALMVGSIFRVGLVKGLMAPALSTAIPCGKNGLVCLVDCGANVECTPEDLKRYALMGNAFMQSLLGEEHPKVGLMSVGREDGKGNTLTKAAFELIKPLGLNFVGNVEGSDLADTELDVVVTDGFTGNILLKNTEECGRAALRIIDKYSDGSEACKNIRNAVVEKFDFNTRGGATFLGLKKTVVKMHGCAVADTVGACIRQIIRIEDRGFSAKVAQAIAE